MRNRIDLFEGDISIYFAPINSDDSKSRRQREVQVVTELVEGVFGKDFHIEHTPEGAPFVPGISRPISVSHSRNLAALAVGARAGSRIGIDAEEARMQLARVAPRVLSKRELDQYSQLPDGLLRAWTMKEALYKAAGIPGLDFSTDIVLPDPADADCVATVRRQRFGYRFHYCGDTLLCAVQDIKTLSHYNL